VDVPGLHEEAQPEDLAAAEDRGEEVDQELEGSLVIDDSKKAPASKKGELVLFSS